MNDTDFEDLRTALSPDSEETARMGGLFVLKNIIESTPDEDVLDERLISLIATLLRERTLAIHTQAAAIAYDSLELRRKLDKELKRLWQLGTNGYRLLLLKSLTPGSLWALASEYAESGDLQQKLLLLERLEKLNAASQAEQAQEQSVLLFLTHDDNPALRLKSLELLGRKAQKQATAAALRLSKDSDDQVQDKAFDVIAELFEPEEGLRQLRAFQASDSLELRFKVDPFIKRLQYRLNLQRVLPLLEEQKRLIQEAQYEEAIEVCSEIFMKLPRHPEARFQAARAHAGLGDTKRCLQLLNKLLTKAEVEPKQVLNEPLFQSFSEVPAWQEVILPQLQRKTES